MRNTDIDKAFFGHPIGLAILFFTEMWERFSYYGMRGLLVLYIYSSIEDGGLGWTRTDALALYGWYTMLVYVMSIPGGIIADKILGQKKTVMLGGLLLCLGHLVLAFEGIYAFFIGLGLIILGVGGLKPNISTMVGGLYKPGDIRRDKGFTIFYIGINVGAFLAGIIVGTVGQKIGWHYGFGLAGLGMILGQIVFIWGQKYLVGVGDLVKSSNESDIVPSSQFGDILKKPSLLILTALLLIFGAYVFLTSSIGYGLLILILTPFLSMGVNIYQEELNEIEKDRVIVLLISFVVIIVFWGAFEQAGGLMNIYANEKIDRVFLGYEIEASVFQSVNSFFIMLFGTAVAAFWANRKLKGKESSSIFKMAVGTMVMGLGFLMMAAASQEASGEPYGTAAMYWLILAYMLHTLGELSASPVSLSFITKLAPAQYASIMMGLYFAATGFGNKLAGTIGEAAQPEAISIELIAEPSELKGLNSIYKSVEEDNGFTLKADIYPQNGDIALLSYEGKEDVRSYFQIDDKNKKILLEKFEGEEASAENPYHAILQLEKDVEAKKVKQNMGDGKNYSGSILVDEIQNKVEFWTFILITIFTVLFGLLLIVFLKKLKKLTHGVEEEERDMSADSL